MYCARIHRSERATHSPAPRPAERLMGCQSLGGALTRSIRHAVRDASCEEGEGGGKWRDRSWIHINHPYAGPTPPLRTRNARSRPELLLTVPRTWNRTLPRKRCRTLVLRSRPRYMTGDATGVKGYPAAARTRKDSATQFRSPPTPNGSFGPRQLRQLWLSVRWVLHCARNIQMTHGL